MKTFNGFLVEAKDKGAVFTFGRFNPPTTGHAKLVDKLKKESKGDDVLCSLHTQTTNKRIHSIIEIKLNTLETSLERLLQT